MNEDDPAWHRLAKMMEQYAKIVDSPAIREAMRMAEQNAKMIETLTSSSAFREATRMATEQQKLFEQSSALMEMDRTQEVIRRQFDGVMKAFGGESTLLMGERLQEQLRSFVTIPDPSQKIVDQLMRSTVDFKVLDSIRTLYEPLSKHAATAIFEYNDAIFSPGAWRGIYGRFEAMQVAYADLVADPMSARLPQIGELALPELGIRVHGTMVRAFEAKGALEEEEPLEKEFSELAAAAPQYAVSRVREVSPRLAEKLESGLRNIGSSDPQAASNACLAVRQVFFGLLNKLAPIALVKEWALAQNDKKLFVDDKIGGTVTHKARLLYISRADLPEKSSYSRSIIASADAAVSFLGLVSKEVHDESPDEPSVILTPVRVRHILFRATTLFGELMICAESQGLLGSGEDES